MKLTIEQVRDNPSIRSYIKKADESLMSLVFWR